jgi:hypothetical protein
MTKRFDTGSMLANWALFSGVCLVEGIGLLFIAVFGCLYRWFDHVKPLGSLAQLYVGAKCSGQSMPWHTACDSFSA